MVKQDIFNTITFIIAYWHNGFCFIFCSNNGVNPLFCCLYSYKTNNNKSGIIVTDKKQYFSRELFLCNKILHVSYICACSSNGSFYNPSLPTNNKPLTSNANVNKNNVNGILQLSDMDDVLYFLQRKIFKKRFFRRYKESWQRFKDVHYQNVGRSTSKWEVSLLINQMWPLPEQK